MTPELMDALAADETAELPLESIPYGRILNAALCREGPRIFLKLRFDTRLIGAPGRLHGGVTGAALEIAAMAELMWQSHQAGTPLGHLPRPITLTVDYLRAGAPEDLLAAAEVSRRGRRMASVRATAWQADSTAPIAEGLLHFLIVQ